jgi:hypothetical protein
MKTAPERQFRAINISGNTGFRQGRVYNPAAFLIFLVFADASDG